MRIFLLVLLILVTGAVTAFGQFSETVPVTTQAFERGQMLWRSDNGTIWVLGNNSQLLEFAAENTVTPSQPVTPSANAANVTPADVFSDLYANDAAVPALIGKPVGVESSFDALFGYANNTISVTLADGSVLLFGPGAIWTRAIEETPESLVPALLSFGYSPDPIEAGATLDIDWAAEGVAWVEIELLAARGSIPVAALRNLAPVGTVTLEVPATVSGALALAVYGYPDDALSADAPLPERTQLTSVELEVLPLPDAVTTTAIFQPFETGFMLWRDDVATAYAFYDTGTYVAFDDALLQTLPDNPISDVKAGYLLPTGVFGRVWGDDAAVRAALGYAFAPGQVYTLAMTLVDGLPVAFTLPDGTTVALEAPNLWMLDV